MADYAQAIALEPRDAYVYANRGITEAEMGDFKAAEKDYSKALMIDSKLVAAYLNRAVVREKLDDWEGAMADCSSAIRLNMFSDDAFGLRGYLWFQHKEYHNAIEDFNRALKANPENKRILMSRAMVWYEMKKYPEVLNDYSEVIRIDSNYIYAYYNRAMLRAEVGEKNAAIRDLDKVVEMNPDNILIYSSIRNMALTSPTRDGHYSAGFIAPRTWCNPEQEFRNICVKSAFRFGFVFSEHANGNNLSAWNCDNAFVFSRMDHSAWFGRIHAQNCANIVSSLNVEFAGHGVGDAFLKIEQVGIEVNSGQKPVDFNYRCFVDDPDNHLYGTLYYHIVKSNVGADNSYFKADGGAHLKAIPSF